jgi:hypothetical protein
LALKGSPTVSLLLFVRGEDILQRTSLGDELQELAPAFLSGRTARAFLGYVDSQARSLRGERHATRTRELSDEHGYDTKFAMHALRIGHQGLELLDTGRITLPIVEPTRSHLRAVRAGTIPLEEILAEIEDLSGRLLDASQHSGVPANPDNARIDAFLSRAYQETWRSGS